MRNGKLNTKTTTGALLGFVVALLICLGSTAGQANLLLTEGIGEGSVEYLISAILLLSSMIGNLVAGKYSEKQLLTVMLCTGFMLSAMILIGLMIDGEFHNVVSRMAAVAGGGLISCVLCLKLSAKPHRRKKHSR